MMYIQLLQTGENQRNINLAAVPIEMLEKIAAQMDLEEQVYAVKTLGEKFNRVCYNVFSKEIRDLGPLIYGQLENAKDDFITTAIDLNAVQIIMFMVSQFSFLQLLNAEYNLLCCVYLDREQYLPKTVLTFQIIDNINEIKSLLTDSADNKFNWNNIAVHDTLDKLRLLNQKVFEMYFMRTWDIKQDRIGPLLMQLLNCALNSSYRVIVCHEETPRCVDSKCHISGHYELRDRTFTQCALPFIDLKDVCRYKILRLLLLFISNVIRVENYKSTLKIRWDTLDLVVKAGERPTLDGEDQEEESEVKDEKPRFTKNFPYLDYLPVIKSEEIFDIRKGLRKVKRVIVKEGESLANTPDWTGMRLDFEVWCPIIEAPTEFFRPEFLEDLYGLADGEFGSYEGEDINAACTYPYEFKLDFKHYVQANSDTGTGIVENCVWVKESILDVEVKMGKELIV
ncbi:hypothetical protein O3M35_000740 [Rhynocoris fuscipes]|uniref:F-box domain-containing protein n=1 Tax=Rhynocoris fuscipes TaxID=488301 RepID=A0AAW1DSI0_9HEMI